MTIKTMQIINNAESHPGDLGSKRKKREYSSSWRRQMQKKFYKPVTTGGQT